jgi:capsular exopolysaccharide synthesis family protein
MIWTGKPTRTQKAFDEYDTKLRAFNIDQINKTAAGLVSMNGPAIVTPQGVDRSPVMLAGYGMVLALIFAVALVVAMDALDNSVRSSNDVEKLLGLPVAGVIPAQLPDPNRAPKITYLDPLSPVSEAYRLLRTDLMFTAEEHPFRSLMCATGKPGQGATTTVCNLAISLAQAGKRVILVDADLRRPRLHAIFNTKNDVGLTSLLNDECEIEEALKATEIDNLLLLPSGPLPLNPSELLASPKMRALHERLKPHTDYILFDTPSAIAFSDSTILASFVDAVLVVVRANNVPRGSELQVKQMLIKARANILGVVLNGMSPEHVDSVHYHYHYYPLLAARQPAGALTNGANGHHNGTNGHSGRWGGGRSR